MSRQEFYSDGTPSRTLVDDDEDQEDGNPMTKCGCETAPSLVDLCRYEPIPQSAEELACINPMALRLSDGKYGDRVVSKDGKAPRAWLDMWLRAVGPSIVDPTMPRCWKWNGEHHFNSDRDMKHAEALVAMLKALEEGVETDEQFEFVIQNVRELWEARKALAKSIGGERDE